MRTKDPTSSQGAASRPRRAIAKHDPTVHAMDAAVRIDEAVLCLFDLDRLPRKSVAEHLDRPMPKMYSNWLT